MKIFSAIALLLLSFPVAGADLKTERAVINAVLKARISEPDVKHLTGLVVNSETSADTSRVMTLLMDQDPAMQDDLLARNATPLTLDKTVPKPLVPFALPRDAARGGYDFKMVRKAVAGANLVLDVSRPGYDSTGKAAIVVVRSNFESGPAFEIYRAYEKGGKWTAINHNQMPPAGAGQPH